MIMKNCIDCGKECKGNRCRNCHCRYAGRMTAGISHGKGVPKSEEHKRKISSSHFGITHTEESKRKMSIAKRGMKLSESWKKAIGDAGRGLVRSQETRNKISAAHKGMKKPWAIESSKRARRKVRRVSSLEIKIRKFLEENHIQYLPQKEFFGIGFVDIFIPESSLVIEADGEYWHSLPGRPEEDKRRTEKLNSLGMRVLRLPEREIRHDWLSCVQKIQDNL